MKRIYKFIAGNSRITPVGIAIALVLVLSLRNTQPQFVQALYIGMLVLTLVASTFERVQ